MFYKNKFTTWYNQIIKNARSYPRTKKERIYLESHHIIPHSLGGSDNVENLVLLTAKEHFICHLLLTKMCICMKHHYKMLLAFNMMKVSNQLQKRVTSRFYHTLKEEIAYAQSELTKGRTFSEERNLKISKALKGRPFTEERKKNIKVNHADFSGKNNPNFNKKTPKHVKEKIKISNIGKHCGEKNPMYGKTHPQNIIDAITKHSREKWTIELREKASKNRSKGTYITPWGTFNSSYKAVQHPHSQFKDPYTVVLRCKANKLGFSFIPKIRN